MVIKLKENYIYSYSKPVPNKIVVKECSPVKLNLEDNKITNHHFGVDTSNVSMLEMNRFTSINKKDINKKSVSIKKDEYIEVNRSSYLVLVCDRSIYL